MSKKKLAYIFLTVLLLSIFIFPYFLKVRSVSCITEDGSCSMEILSDLEQVKGDSYFQAKKKAISFLSKNPLVTSYKIYFSFPDIFLVKLGLVKVDCILKNSKTGYFYLIDGLGKVLAEKGSIDRRSFVETKLYDLKVGQKVEDKVLMAISVFSYLDYLYKIDYSRLFEDRLEVKLNNGPVLILPVEGKDEKFVVGSVRFLVSQLEDNYEKFRVDKSYDNITIDLRYKNPILK